MKFTYTLPCNLKKLHHLRNIKALKNIAFLLLLTSFVFSTACSRQQDVRGLEIDVWMQGEPLLCERFGYEQQTWLVRQLAFFISDVTFHLDSTEFTPELTQSDWQTSNLSLIQPNLKDCATEGGAANPSGSELLAGNHAIKFSAAVNVKEMEELSFTVGVPFELNHQNPLQQPSPLNLPSMFWSWRSGHKFFRMDLQAPDKSWVFHLGSVGCESASVMRSPQLPCLQPNSVHFRLPKGKSGHRLILHLDRLLKGVSVNNDESCLFHGEQSSCMILMDNFNHQQVFEWH